MPEGLYILPMFFIYLFIYFFNGRHRSPDCSEANGPIFTKISGLVDGCNGLITLLSFFDFSRDVAMATNRSRKIGIFPGPIYFVVLPFKNGLQYRNSDFEMFNTMNFSTLCRILVTFGTETPEFSLRR